MNAAARVINQSTLFTGHFMSIRLTKTTQLLFLLLGFVLLSALGVVYTTNDHRMRFSQLQQMEFQAHQLQVQWEQLLLEQASLATPARVERLAIRKLEMHLPSNQETIVLHTR